MPFGFFLVFFFSFFHPFPFFVLNLAVEEILGPRGSFLYCQHGANAGTRSSPEVISYFVRSTLSVWHLSVWYLVGGCQEKRLVATKSKHHCPKSLMSPSINVQFSRGGNEERGQQPIYIPNENPFKEACHFHVSCPHLIPQTLCMHEDLP